jgi:hypothetical protein
MKRVALAVAVLGLVACKRSEEAAPAADSAAAPAAAPAPAMDTSMTGDSMMMGDTSKMMGEMKKAN